MTTPVAIVNPGFDSDASGWDLRTVGGATLGWSSSGGDGGSPGCIVFGATGEGQSITLLPDAPLPLTPGKSITVSARARLAAGSPGEGANINLLWYGPGGSLGSTSTGVYNRKAMGSEYFTMSVTGTPPAGATLVYPAIFADSGTGITTNYFDSFNWNNTIPDLSLQFPGNGSVYADNASVPYRIDGYSGLDITEVTYKVENVSTAAVTTIGVAHSSPWSLNDSSLDPAQYRAWAEVNIGGYILTTNSNVFNVGELPPPATREYKASNAYAYLVNSNFSNIGSAIPSTARVVGVKAIVDYNIKALIRSKDKGVSDPTVARYAAAFSMVPSATFEVAMLDNTSGSYVQVGTNITAEESIDSSDYLLQEDGISDNKRWTVLQGDAKTVEIGGADSFFGQPFMAASDFFNKSVGIRCYPNLSSIPSYADSGDACFRVNLDKFRLQVYFDPGSVEYYFVSPDETQIIKGRLVHFCVDNGDFRTGDAAGTMQFEYDLEVQDGDQTYVGPDWTIHSEYPPTDTNRIADVVPVSIDPTWVDDPEDPDDVPPLATGMEYNALPTQQQVLGNGSRYEFITHNFYGDKDWDAVYGVNGYGKAFSFNGEWFYKICTNPDMDKDKPRHVAAHHQHLALGFPEGRVDISVVGEPYNYSGFLGASSWAIGDTVTGLLPLSGTILGVFGGKSIWGISGTTVDNFATQILTPNIGAIEYTIVDMGYPVYANTYGIYTLAQTQQYGDYLGTPMSVDVSPWLRSRLIRAPNSVDGVVAAWPVRHKNQYRLSFNDGMVLTMTVNAGNQQAPTFSLQKYDLNTTPIWDYDSEEYEGPGNFIPAAISSQFDHTGKERIHMAPVVSQLRSQLILNMCLDVSLFISGSSEVRINTPSDSWPDWLDLGNYVYIQYNSARYYFYVSSPGVWATVVSIGAGPSEMDGTINSDYDSACAHITEATPL